jgi:hypothetical protein
MKTKLSFWLFSTLIGTLMLVVGGFKIFQLFILHTPEELEKMNFQNLLASHIWLPFLGTVICTISMTKSRNLIESQKKI